MDLVYLYGIPEWTYAPWFRPVYFVNVKLDIKTGSLFNNAM